MAFQFKSTYPTAERVEFDNANMTAENAKTFLIHTLNAIDGFSEMVSQGITQTKSVPKHVNNCGGLLSTANALMIPHIKSLN